MLQCSTVFVEVSKGFGKTISDISSIDLVQLQKVCPSSEGSTLVITSLTCAPVQALYTSDILYILTLWLTKCSVGFLFLRLSPDKNHKMMSNMILLASTVLMVVSVFIVALRCDLTHPWIFVNEQCTNLVSWFPSITCRLIII